ncbi:DUF6461 domain-containing protein [Actinoplanes rectilineatus]|uniref:DUF6461 domain-containing protein n=1 Tax=Actinoplanes rectilineatus TaxID=113571 RepID=UPI0012F75B89|nr:DUF6461 domain-containing protein [Actinoplanes rectilineatus]
MSADDYAWFTEQCADLADAYCLTLVRGRTPAEAVETLGGRDPVPVTGLRALSGDPASAAGFVAATAMGDWTLIVEPDGVRGGDEARTLSRGTVLVSHYRSDGTDPRFVWARDGEIVLEFDPSSPEDRRGTDPDGLAEVLDRLGFQVGGEDAPDRNYDDRYRERALALAEQLTGVRITLEDLEAATFQRAALGEASPAQPEAVSPAARPSPRPPARGEKWDEEYEVDDEDDDELREDGDEDGDGEREWPRLVAASARRIGRIFR